MTKLEMLLRDLLNSGAITTNQAFAINGACEMLNDGVSCNQMIHPDNFIINYGTFAVEGLNELMSE